MNRRLLIAGCLLVLLAACAVRSERNGPLYYNGAFSHTRYIGDGYGSGDGNRLWDRDRHDIRTGYTANSGWRE